MFDQSPHDSLGSTENTIHEDADYSLSSQQHSLRNFSLIEKSHKIKRAAQISQLPIRTL